MLPSPELSKNDKEIIDWFYDEGKKHLLGRELYTELSDFEKLLSEVKDYRGANLHILDIGKRENFKIDEKVQEEFGCGNYFLPVYEEFMAKHHPGS